MCILKCNPQTGFVSVRCAKQMLLQGSNRIPADANERFEDNFDDDAAILLQLIRSIISRQKRESVSKILEDLGE